MSRTVKHLNERAPLHMLYVNVLLPTHRCRGHAGVHLYAEIVEGELTVGVRVDGEDFRTVLSEQWRFSAEDLGISSSERKT